MMKRVRKSLTMKTSVMLIYFSTVVSRGQIRSRVTYKETKWIIKFGMLSTVIGVMKSAMLEHDGTFVSKVFKGGRRS